MISDSVDPKSVLVHGTSVEAAIRMIENGRLEQQFFTQYPDYIHEGYLFFDANPQRFRNHGYVAAFRQEFDIRWKQCQEKNHPYAVSLGQSHFLSFHTGRHHSALTEFNFGPDFAYEKHALYQIELFEEWIESTELQKNDIMWLLSIANNRKGVLLCIDESIIDGNIEIDEEDFSLSIYMPDGLDIKHVRSIVPQGEVERKILEGYLFEEYHPELPLKKIRFFDDKEVFDSGVEEYEEKLRKGIPFNPLSIFVVDDKYYARGGRHRTKAHMNMGLKTMPYQIKNIPLHEYDFRCLRRGCTSVDELVIVK